MNPLKHLKHRIIPLFLVQHYVFMIKRVYAADCLKFHHETRWTSGTYDSLTFFPCSKIAWVSREWSRELRDWRWKSDSFSGELKYPASFVANPSRLGGQTRIGFELRVFVGLAEFESAIRVFLNDRCGSVGPMTEENSLTVFKSASGIK